VPHNRPPYNYVDGDVDMASVLTAADLDPTIYGNRDFIANEGMSALWELFSDGELRILTYDQFAAPGDMQKTSGKERFGEFYDKLAKLQRQTRQESGDVTDNMNRLARFCGRALAEAVSAGAVQTPDAKMVRVGTNSLDDHVFIKFDSYRWRSQHPVGVIMEYGPGVGGKRIVDAQLAALDMGAAPFQYVAISDGPFVNQFLMSYLGNQLESSYGPGASAYANSGRLIAGREDGMLQATTNILDASQPSGSHEMCDAILFTGLHDVDPTELEFAIRNSPQLLRGDGKVFLSAPIPKLRPDLTTFAEQLSWAMQAGLRIEWQKEVATGDPKMGTDTISGLAVLEK
ncbi:MAG: hypothetical protein JWP13_960, partial [Candidatus Saccharibacteria bacterium]|nr:hypothetical protein [Candidatus Saccharibacteria bacterium]